MKLKSIKRLICVSALGLLAAHMQAQVSPLAQPGINAAMIKLFGPATAFSAKTQVQMLDKAGKETMSLPMNFAFLNGKIRIEVDMTELKSKEVTADTITPLKQMGMEKLVSIVRPDKKTTLIIYPAIKSYTETPMSAEDVADLQKEYKIEKKLLGKETLDGHPCEKYSVSVVDPKGGKQEASVWNATDLKNFPVQMQMNQTEATVVMRYRDILLAKPEDKQFEVPAGFTKYESMEKMMQGAMMKMLGGK